MQSATISPFSSPFLRCLRGARLPHQENPELADRLRCGDWPGYHTFAPQGIGPLWALAGFAVGFSLLIVPWLLGGGGMGDVKMLAALGTWLGPLLVLVAFGWRSDPGRGRRDRHPDRSAPWTAASAHPAALSSPPARRRFGQQPSGHSAQRSAACCPSPCPSRSPPGWCLAGCCFVSSHWSLVISH